MSLHYLYGYLYPHLSFDVRSCRLRAYVLYICGYTFFHSFSIQAIYRICRILYPLQTTRQPFSLYVIILIGQWILSAVELFPSLMIGDIQYLPYNFYCQFSPANMRGSLTVCLVGFLLPFTIMACCYFHTICYVRKNSSTIVTFKQRVRVRRDLTILKRIIRLLTVLSSSAIPHAVFPIIYLIYGKLPTWLVPLEWVLTIVALIITSIFIPYLAPHMKKMYNRKHLKNLLSFRTHKQIYAKD
ncbi:unnamed protein product [Adineta ricciae]|uniref:G-protein coupled receptors family 1 profile domain-containing protein n=1 Tax=Adineta ricciae TaxID=249248 RepID=A0A813PFK6_ADIRI|nr:unnamed protein product [Adineta ricciae]